MKRLFFLTLATYAFNCIANIVPSGSALSIIGPTTITIPGSYTLARDIVGTVTIDANQVFFNLNEKSISGIGNAIEVAAGHEDIEIRNGIIRDSNMNGISISPCTNIIIEDIDFVANTRGILVETTTNLHIRNTSFREHTNFESIVRFQNCNNGIIQQCIFDHNQTGIANSKIIYLLNSFNFQLSDYLINNNTSTNVTDIILLENVSYLSSKRCQINNNQANTMVCLNIEDGSTSCNINSCSIMNNITDTFRGMLIGVTGSPDLSKNVIISNANISNNIGNTFFSGIEFGTSSTVCSIIDSIIEDNQSSSENGILISGNTHYIANNIVKNNNSFGINDGSVGSIFINNKAQANNTNFNSLNPWPITVVDFTASTYTPSGAGNTAYDNLDII